MLQEFAIAAYELTDIDPDADTIWRNVLQNEGSQPGYPDTTGPDASDARPARTRVVMAQGFTDSGTVALEPGGISYVELDPPGDGPDILTLTVEQDGEHVVGEVISYSDYPTDDPCDREALEFDDLGAAHLEFMLDDGCEYALLALSHTGVFPEGLFGPGASKIGWSATVGTGRVDNGTIQLGVGRYGELIVPGDVPSSTFGELAVGMRFMATNSDAVSPDCWCEGWGVADLNSGESGWASYGGTDVEGLDALGFRTEDETAHSRVSMGGRLEITHDFEPSAATDNLYVVDVTIENTSQDVAEVTYRRFIDWDVEPTPFDEWVSSVAPDGLPASMIYVGNDPFIAANPFDFLTAPLTGTWEAAGPEDQGIAVDLDLGEIEPGASVTFTLYLGAAESRAAAEAAIGAVDMDWYSLGIPDTTGAPTTGTPNTFVFGYKEPEGLQLTMSPDAPSSLSATGGSEGGEQPTMKSLNTGGD